MENLSSKLHFQAADIIISLDSIARIGPKTLEPKFNLFKTNALTDKPVTIKHYLSEMPKSDQLKEKELKTVLKNDTWKLSVSESTCIYRYHSEKWYPIPYSVACVFNGSHDLGKVYFSGINQVQYKQLRLTALSGLATDQILFSKLLAQQDGFLFHSNGICLSEKTLLFTGHSGAGKSTLSAMLKNTGAKIFCDDRIIIQKKNSGFLASGSWIHPGVTEHSKHSGKIDAVFFIEQSDRNEIRPMDKKTVKYQKAIKALVKNFLLTSQWESTLNILEHFVQSTPFFTLKFDLTGKICHHIFHEIRQLS